MTDDFTTEVGFGGGAGGAKSWLGCVWIISMAETKAGTRYLLGRKSLKNLKRTTLVTFFMACEMYGFQAGIHFRYNQNDSMIYWHNGSEILLMDLAPMPSDPLYLRLGGLELTAAFVDESNEVGNKAIDILSTRVGRFKNELHKIKPKILETFNPDKGHVYRRYYKPDRDNEMPKYRVFIKALAVDNPWIPQSYIEQLKKADPITRERLLYGNFEYDDDPSKLFEVDAIMDLFTTKPKEREGNYISCDVARFGADKTVIGVWSGLFCKEIHTYPKTSITQVISLLEGFCKKHEVQRSHVIVDEDGVGGGVVDGFKGCKGFVNNSVAIQPKNKKRNTVVNFANLKTQCYFEFARLCNDGKIGVGIIDSENKDNLIEELEQVKQKDIDKEGKIRLIGKDKIKEEIGRSPDIADMIMMRMFYELKKITSLKPIFID